MKARSIVIAAVVALGGASLAERPAATPHYPTCRQMHRTYPNGVGRSDATTTGVRLFRVSDAVYAANSTLDTDGDGVACEVKRAS